MKAMYALTVSVLLLSSCDNSRSSHDTNLNEVRDEAAAEDNADKFAGKKQRDADFVFEVVASNYGEIKLAELASQKTSVAEVRKVAEKLLADHTAALNALKTLAQAEAIAVPVEETDAARNKLEDLAGESNETFEEEWCDEMIDLHDKAINKFENRLADTENAELKAFVNKTLPVLKHHREDLRACLERITEKSG